MLSFHRHKSDLILPQKIWLDVVKLRNQAAWVNKLLLVLPATVLFCFGLQLMRKCRQKCALPKSLHQDTAHPPCFLTSPSMLSLPVLFTIYNSQLKTWPIRIKKVYKKKVYKKKVYSCNRGCASILYDIAAHTNYTTKECLLQG